MAKNLSSQVKLPIDDFINSITQQTRNYSALPTV